jgi:hypothetical protein
MKMSKYFTLGICRVKIDIKETEWTGEHRSVAGFHKHGNNLLASVKSRKFLD